MQNIGRGLNLLQKENEEIKNIYEAMDKRKQYQKELLEQLEERRQQKLYEQKRKRDMEIEEDQRIKREAEQERLKFEEEKRERERKAVEFIKKIEINESMYLSKVDSKNRKSTYKIPSPQKQQKSYRPQMTVVPTIENIVNAKLDTKVSQKYIENYRETNKLTNTFDNQTEERTENKENNYKTSIPSFSSNYNYPVRSATFERAQRVLNDYSDSRFQERMDSIAK